MAYLIEKGRNIFQEVYGEVAADGIKACVDSDDFVVETAKRITDFVLGIVRALEVR